MNYFKTLFQLIVFSAISIIPAKANNLKDTVWNHIDEKGQKQGLWRISYENGKIKYEGFFKNNKPLGVFKRYYEDGIIKAFQYFHPDGKTVSVKMYYNNGILAATGRYVNSLKDSIWSYYSYYDNKIKLIENYSNGKKEGLTQKFYESGQIAEELTWKENFKDGPWTQYYQNGTVLLKATYKNDKRQGLFTTYYPGNKVESQGNFVDNLMDGEWSYFDESGNVKMKIIYKKGVPQNADQLNKIEEEFFKKLEENKGKIPEPDENSLLPQ